MLLHWPGHQQSPLHHEQRVSSAGLSKELSYAWTTCNCSSARTAEFRHALCAGYTCGSAPASKTDVLLAISQCVQQLEQVINDINEAVLEVRYELAEP